MSRMYQNRSRVSRTTRALIITETNQACLAKMTGCGLQEGVLAFPNCGNHESQFNASTESCAGTILGLTNYGAQRRFNRTPFNASIFQSPLSLETLLKLVRGIFPRTERRRGIRFYRKHYGAFHPRRPSTLLRIVTMMSCVLTFCVVR
jgi:hypothetical protein